MSKEHEFKMIVFSMILIPILLGLSVMACLPKTSYDNCELQIAQMVRSIVSEQVGQIIRRNAAYKDGICTYDVRFSANQDRTDTHLLSNDGPIQFKPLAVVRFMRGYELEEVES